MTALGADIEEREGSRVALHVAGVIRDIATADVPGIMLKLLEGGTQLNNSTGQESLSLSYLIGAKRKFNG